MIPHTVSFVLFAALNVRASTTQRGDRCEELDSFSALQQRAHWTRASAQTPDVQADRVPKIVHHIYKYDISRGPWPNAIWEQSFLSWKKHFPEPEYRHIFWSDEHTLAFVQRECSEFSSSFSAESRDIVKSDFSRYCILWRLGGIYADLDYMPLRNFYEDLRPGMVSLIQSPYHSETFQNSLMASPAGYAYWEKLMELARYTMKATNVLLAAGPQLLEILPLTKNTSLVNVLPCNEYQRATHHSERGSAIRKGCRLLRPDDVFDASMKGIHWGTTSYADNGKTYKAPVPKDLLQTWSLFETNFKFLYDTQAVPDQAESGSGGQAHDRDQWLTETPLAHLMKLAR